ncbi:MAG: choice-of-anchor D domain-containing protein, partial [Bacteroidia bacterium]
TVSSFYCSGEAARDSIIAKFNWLITDNGKNCVTTAPEIKISSSTTEIIDNDVTPSLVDSTNLGSVDTNSTAQVATFAITNMGAKGDTLNLTGNPVVALSGTGASHFSVVNQPSKTQLDSGETTTFTVKFFPTVVGTHNAELSIANNDADENPYNFSIQGTGTAVAAPAPEISIVNNGIEITSGDNTPSVADSTDFGKLDTNTTASITYYIKNTGNDILKLNSTPVLLTGNKGAEFVIAKQPSTSIVAGDSSAFTVSFVPTFLGSQSITLRINSNDADEDPYTFDVSGTGTAVAATAACSTYFPAPYKAAWMSGNSSTNNTGSYGPVGTASASYYPHSGNGFASWVDSNKNFYLFGGYSEKTNRYYNSLWKTDGTTWTLVHGSAAINSRGTYGTKGTGSTSTKPGARSGAATFVDANNHLWLFGGYGYDSKGSKGRLNDLWKWDGSVWTWVSGNDVINTKSVHGTTGVAASSNIIGATESPSSWLDANGDFWVFGGYGIVGSNYTYKNELWKWDGSNWTFIKGDKTAATSTYGIKGTANANNTPGSRFSANSWTDDKGNFWLFGGYGADYNNTYGYLNDLWKFDGSNWTWMHGDSIADLKPKYGEQLVTKSSNDIGGRSKAVQFTDCQGNVYIAGGEYENNNYNSTTVFDLWKYDGTDWTWLQGDTSNTFGSNSSKGIPSYKAWPSARKGASSFYNDSSGVLTVFGGTFERRGFDYTKNDLWQIDSVNLYAEIYVKYDDSKPILHRSTIIHDSIGTDFGTVDTNYANIKKSFTIGNNGNFELTLPDSVPVRITGAGASHFRIKYQPYNIIDEGRRSIVDVIFRPTTVGVHTATITIPSNDKDENPFTFNVQGEGKKASPLTAQVTVISDANCYNRADGVATAVVSGGGIPYTYLWSNGDTSLTSSALMGGTQTFTVTDATSTQYSVSVTINRPAAIPVSIAEGDTVYIDGKDSVMATIASQDTSLRYVWSNICEGGSDVWEPVGNTLFSPGKIDD